MSRRPDGWRVTEAAAGAAARQAGLPRAANPYRDGTAEHDRWDLAWLFTDTAAAGAAPDGDHGMIVRREMP